MNTNSVQRATCWYEPADYNNIPKIAKFIIKNDDEITLVAGVTLVY